MIHDSHIATTRSCARRANQPVVHVRAWPAPRLGALAMAIFAAWPLFASAAAPDADDGTGTLPAVIVQGAREPVAAHGHVGAEQIAREAAASSDVTSLLDALPGYQRNAAGGVSGFPALHGLADDRLRIFVDGAEITASCPNHMNTPLSYLAPSDVARIVVYPGITPVSLGGDSIGGTIEVERRDPQFALPGEGLLTEGNVGAYYRSNGNAWGANVRVHLAGEHLSATYSGNTASADDYRAGADFKSYTFTGRAGHALDRDVVGSSAYTTRNQALQLAYQQGNHLLTADFGWQNLPEQLYPNQRMDMLENLQKRLNLRYRGLFDWGKLELAAYRETLHHFMDFGADKRYWYGSASGGNNPPGGDAVACTPIGMTCAAGMPMYTDSDTSAVSMDADILLASDGHLRIGAEHRRYRLHDWWPPSGAMMWPGTFENVLDGQRDRSALYAEWQAVLSPRWSSELGMRYEHVAMDAGNVRGYDPTTNAMGSWQLRDATAFNARKHARGDDNWDFSAIVRYHHDQTLDLAFGLARKVRSPGLYEVYPWSTWQMAALMNNFVGDGNGYIGNPDLLPEKAVTVSATLDWHAADGRWAMQVTPWLTRVTDYIDAVQWDATTNAPRTLQVVGNFSVLRYVNTSARLHGVDLSARLRLGEGHFGRFETAAVLNYLRGENTRSGDGLYNQMPLNARLSLSQAIGAWDNRIELLAVARKDRVSAVRNELVTPGYALLNVRVSRRWDRVRVDAGVDNLLDRFYWVPTGGAYVGQGTTMAIPPLPNQPQWGTQVPGMGRSFHVAVNYRF